MQFFYEKHKQLIDKLAFFALIMLFVYGFFIYLFEYVAPFFFGLIIALVMEPLIRLLVDKVKFRRWIAALTCLLIFMAAMGSLGVWLINTLLGQVGSFVESAPSHIEDFIERLETANEWLAGWEMFLPETWYIPDIQEMLVGLVTNLFGEAARAQGINMITGVPNFFIGVILTLVSAYFFMADRQIIFEAIRKRSPDWLNERIRLMRSGLSKALDGYFRAQYILMAMAGIICIAGLLILRNPYALLIGLLVAVLDFLPILGTGTVLLPWALFSALIGEFRQAVWVLAIYGIITITRQVLEPKILGEQIGVHPLVSLMSVFIGFRIFGLLGLLIGPTLVMVFLAIQKNEDRV